MYYKLYDDKGSLITCTTLVDLWSQIKLGKFDGGPSNLTTLKNTVGNLFSESLRAEQYSGSSKGEWSKFIHQHIVKQRASAKVTLYLNCHKKFAPELYLPWLRTGKRSPFVNNLYACKRKYIHTCNILNDCISQKQVT